MFLRPTRSQRIESPNTRIDRRRFLQFGVAAATSLILPDALGNIHNMHASPIAQPERKLSLLNLHTGESITATYWAEGQYQGSELAAINNILRDHRTGDVHQMDSELLELLNMLHQKVGAKEFFQVISGYRSPKTNAALNKKSNGVAKKSLHMQGKAIDIRLPGCDLSDLQNAAISCQKGGVGFYSKSDFIHIDTGRVRRWG
ncbi:FIG001587: exported protein [hydrothermal vent metagenome]|uniref:Murein endopeptidase K n=1 Tax=hydrothermal vent metagenome TaxID=652676 RepID=A0A3B0WG91_9ZZZZ